MPGKVMNPERLAEVREMSVRTLFEADVLADRDHWEAVAREAKANLKEARSLLEAMDVRLVERQRERDEARAEIARLRSRVQVTAEDVERARVTPVHVEAWLRAAGWENEGRDRFARGGGMVTVRFEPVDPDAIRIIAAVHKRRGLDILDEMAAMPAEGEGA